MRPGRRAWAPLGATLITLLPAWACDAGDDSNPRSGWADSPPASTSTDPPDSGSPARADSGSDADATGADAGPPPTTNVDPSHGSGGNDPPGAWTGTPLGARIWIPTSYDPANLASPVVWLFNEIPDYWQDIANQNDIIVVDLNEYNNEQAYANKLNETLSILEPQYNVDRARYFWAGWSAGGNVILDWACLDHEQDMLAGVMTFPGSGGQDAVQPMKQRTGHKIRLLYAVGDQDGNYPWQELQLEPSLWSSYGYTTRFQVIAGASHDIVESKFHVRAAAWAWMKDFNLKN